MDRQETYSNWGATLTIQHTMRTRGRVTLSKQSLPDKRQQLWRPAISMLNSLMVDHVNAVMMLPKLTEISEWNQQKRSGVKVILISCWSVCTNRKDRSPYSSLHQQGDQTWLLCRAHSTFSVTSNIQRIWRERCGVLHCEKGHLDEGAWFFSQSPSLKQRWISKNGQKMQPDIPWKSAQQKLMSICH